ncbi:MAG: Holliday junction resolvase RuvX [Thermotogota bacterium]
MNYYGIDYGDKKCGIAKANEILKIASPHTTIDKKDLKNFLKSQLKTNDIVVFGLPKSMSSNFSKQSFKTINQAIEISKDLDNDFYLVDERLTTQSLYNEMKGKVNSKKIKKTKDQNSATLILSVFLKNENIGYLINEKEIYTIDKDKVEGKNVLVQDVAIKKPKENFNYEIKDPWLFWYYFSRNIFTEYSVIEKSNFDIIINFKNIENYEK